MTHNLMEQWEIVVPGERKRGVAYFRREDVLIVGPARHALIGDGDKQEKVLIRGVQLRGMGGGELWVVDSRAALSRLLIPSAAKA